MRLRDLKFGAFKVKIADLDTRITNKAQWLKQQFDARGDELKEALNNVLEALSVDEGENPGAGLLGAVDWDGESISIEEHIQDEENPHNVKALVKKMLDQAVMDSGNADMTKAVYDPQGKQTDIYAYTDNAIAAAIGAALTGEV